MSDKMPVLFIGHGSPENAFAKNEFNENWKKLAKQIPEPKAILCVSAHWVTSTHWVTSGAAVTARATPRTIHDFYGFPNEYYSFQYPAAGSRELAEQVKSLVKCLPVELDYEWGLDHGTWSVLANMYPNAIHPVIQLSIDDNLALDKHMQIGQELQELRRDGVLLIGSGNIVHNLMTINPGEPYPWAVDFDARIKEALERKDKDTLVNYQKLESAKMALPTDEHYLPLLYVAGAAEKEFPQFFNEKIVYGSVGMRCVVYWDKKLTW
jgi:4,5-DOPA dioxygenase extradiol